MQQLFSLQMNVLIIFSRDLVIVLPFVSSQSPTSSGLDVFKFFFSDQQSKIQWFSVYFDFNSFTLNFWFKLATLWSRVLPLNIDRLRLTDWFCLREPGGGRHGARHRLQLDHLLREEAGRRVRRQGHEDRFSLCYHCGRSTQVRRVEFGKPDWPSHDALGVNVWNMVLLLRTGRAARCCLERGDDMLITSGRHPFLGKYRV